MESVFLVDDRLSLAFCSVFEASTALRACQKTSHFISMSASYTDKGSIVLKRIDEICKFTKFVQRVLRTYPTKTIVFCIGQECAASLTTAALLLGGFLILAKGLSFEHVKTSFRSVEDRFISFNEGLISSRHTRHTVQDLWLALYHARMLDWIDLSSEIKPGMDMSDFGSFDIETYAHYAAASNGGIVTVVPRKLLFFPSPMDLPDGIDWIDSSDGMHRSFSAAYYASILSTDHDVSLVLCIDSGISHWHAFAVHGIVTEDLPLDGSLLHSLDRLLALTDAGRGTIALHSSPRATGCGAGALVAAYLVRRLGFSPSAAVAWICMAHPGLLDPAVPSARTLPGRAPIRRCESMVCGSQEREPAALASASKLAAATGQEWETDAAAAFDRAGSWPLCTPALTAPEVFDFC
jgi:hypothetical protein